MLNIFKWHSNTTNFPAPAPNGKLGSDRSLPSGNTAQPEAVINNSTQHKAALATQSNNQRQRFLSNMQTPLEHGKRNIDRELKGPNLLIFKFTLENLLKDLNSTSSTKACAAKAEELLANLSGGEIRGLASFTPEEKGRLFGELNALLQASQETQAGLQKKFTTTGLAQIYNPPRQENIKQTLDALAVATRLLGALAAAVDPNKANHAGQDPTSELAGAASAMAMAAGDVSVAPPGSARSQAIDRLEQVKEHFKALHEGNWSPGATDDHYDAAILPVLVAAENARSPGLHLQLLRPDQDFASWLKQEHPANARVMFTIPGHGPHQVVADIRREGGKTSVLVIEPLTFVDTTRDRYKETTLPLLKKSLEKSNVNLSILTLDTQKSTNDCRIFALSAASKLADNKTTLDALHLKNLSGSSLKTPLGKKAEVLAGDKKLPLFDRLAGKEKIRVLDGKGVLPSTFFKHSQSKTTIANWIKANPHIDANAAINKAGQSLTARNESHKVTRYDKPVHTQFMKANLEEIEVMVKDLTFSDSIEQKRLTYLDRAIAYLKEAPDAECSNLLANMGSFGDEPPGPDNLHLDDRDWGPHPDTL